jgi:predicted nucleic acid-binding protein
MAIDAAHVNCLDASALVKLVVEEDRSLKLRQYLAKSPQWYTTPFCFYEALGVLKAKYLFKNTINNYQYRKFSFDLMSEYRGGQHYIPDLDLLDVTTFAETQKLCDKHGLDLSDSFQILGIIKGCPFVGNSRTILVTDDGKLAEAARAENCRVWHLPDDPPS